ncbi:MAG: hypothetical protein KGY49_03755 [Wenzhouxiangellaceae bacterium]|nr:hypothetical protein [Wenzhouxiangellaceae bacterium]
MTEEMPSFPARPGIQSIHPRQGRTLPMATEKYTRPAPRRTFPPIFGKSDTFPGQPALIQPNGQKNRSAVIEAGGDWDGSESPEVLDFTGFVMYDRDQETRDESSGSGNSRVITHYRQASRPIPLVTMAEISRSFSS